MTDNAYVDGNALGGLFFELFDQDMTGQLGRCGSCGSIEVLAEVHVYRDAPGDVMRCPVCGMVLMVVVPMRTGYRVSFESLSWIEIGT